MAASSTLKPLLDFASHSPSPGDLEKVALVTDFLRESHAVTGRAAGPLQLVSVNMYEKENAKENNTALYKQIYDRFPSCVLRRGNLFRVGVRFNQYVELDKLDVKVNLVLGLNPTPQDGTMVQLKLPTVVDDTGAAHGDPLQWSISVSFHQHDMMMIKFRSPVMAPVGRWTLSFQIGTALQITERRIYIVCNPWLREDPVFMEDDSEREFYTLKDTCILYLGTYKHYVPKKWYLGQFERATLEAIEFLLRESKITAAQRADQSMLVRTLSAVDNSQDENGLLFGNWNGVYPDGTNPMAWNSSPPIIHKFFESGGNTVKYGQCMVFGALLTTMMRALGIPSRTVTNFPSAHVGGGDMTVHYYYDEDGNYLKNASEDMEWNFHVWSECWMARPDLPPGFGGWQVVDGTPQIKSDSKFQVGPYPVKAILEDNFDMKYDGRYTGAAVKAVYKYYRKNPIEPTGWTLVSTKTDGSGRLLLTEKPTPPGHRPEPEEITYTYRSKTAPGSRSAPMEVIELQLKCDQTVVAAGAPIRVVCTVKNNAKEAHEVVVSLKASSVEYNNKAAEEVGGTSRKLQLAAGAAENIELKIDADAYLGKLRPGAMIKIEAVASFKDGMSSNSEVVTVRMPALSVEVLSREKPLGALKYKLNLSNPLAVPLTDCELIVELPCSTYLLKKIAVGDVPCGGVFEKTGVLHASSLDTDSIVATFMSKQLPVVAGAKQF